MMHRTLAALFALSMVHCEHDIQPTTLNRTPSVLPAVSHPVVAAASVSSREAVFPLVSHAGRRWMVLARGLDADRAVGPLRLVQHTPDDGTVVVEATARPEAVPARWAQAEGRGVLLHDASGASCRATLRAPTVLARVDVNVSMDQRWDGFDQEGNRIAAPTPPEQVAREAFAEADGDRYLVAELSATGCAHARWANEETDAVVRYAPSEADDLTRQSALAAFRATPAWSELQGYFREDSDGRTEAGYPRPPQARWDEDRRPPAVRVWRAEGSARSFVTVRAEVPNEGCGPFSGSLWAVFERTPEGLVRRTSASEGGAFAPDEAVDANGDGFPEFISDEGVMRIGASHYDEALTVEIPSRDCPC